VAIGANKYMFLDGLLLQPRYDALWVHAMGALLEKLGPGTYCYGSELSLEAAREEDLKSVRGVAVEIVRPLVVHSVDFGRWPTWSDYWSAISNNSRRNAKRAEQTIPGLKLVVREGLISALDIPKLIRLRASMYERKGLEFQALRAGASYLGSIAGCPEHVVTAAVYKGRHAIAAFSGIEFGTHTYYRDGGSLAEHRGAAWYLQLAMLRRAYDRHGAAGKFIMGYVDFASHDEAVGGGLLRSRRALRVTDYPTSCVTFSYRGNGPLDPVAA
jgi:hypothetical protein